MPYHIINSNRRVAIAPDLGSAERAVRLRAERGGKGYVIQWVSAAEPPQKREEGTQVKSGPRGRPPRLFDFGGEMVSLAQASAKCGVPVSTLWNRLRLGVQPPELWLRALPGHTVDQPDGTKVHTGHRARPSKLWPFRGEHLTLAEIALRVDVPEPTLRRRTVVEPLGDHLWRPAEHRGRPRKVKQP